MHLLESIKKKKIYFIIVIFLIFFVFLINLFFISKDNFKQNIAQNLRILTCQPNFTTTKDSTKFKIKRLAKGFGNFIKNGCDYETLNININLKNYKKIKDDRAKAIDNTILINPQEVSSTIYFNNDKYKSKVRLKGDLPNHWNLNKQWSLKIELKDGKSINGMKEFSITKLIERRFPDNLLIANQFNRLDVHSPRFKIYKTIVNGENWGLMIAEEQFSNVFLENRKLKDGLIFKLTNEGNSKLNKYLGKNKLKPQNALLSKQGKIEVDFYNSKEINKLTYLQNQETLIKSINSILNSNYRYLKKYNLINDYFDIKKLANLFANSMAFNSLHSLYFNNVRFYLNPYSLIIEPIPTDNTYNNVPNFDKFILQLEELNIFYKILFNNKDFIDEYTKSLNKIKKDIPNIKKDSIQLCLKFEKYCNRIINFKNFEKHLDKLIALGKNIFSDYSFSKIDTNNTINSNLKNISSTQKEIEALDYLNNFIYARLFKDYIKFYNLTLDEILIKKILIYGQNSKKTNKCKLYTKKNCIIGISNFDIKLDKNINNISYEKTEYSLLKNIENPIWGEIFGEIKEKNFKYVLRFENNSFDEKFFLNKNIENNKKFLNTLDKNTFFLAGKIFIDQPILVPKNFNLKIMPGSELIFAKNSYIYLNQGNLIIDGKQKQVILKPEDQFWGGIYVYNAKKKSKIINTIITSTKNFEHNGIFLTGGVSFYKSDVEILNSHFLKSKSEDALNVIKSKFDLKNSYFENTLSDGIDLDFSIGKIINTKFKHINGDAVDTSGSLVEIIDTEISYVDDKAVSVGENSNVNIKNLKINFSKFGIASKDLSSVRGENISIKNSQKYDLMAFEKKMHFGPGFLKLDNVKFNDKIISQENSTIIINNKKIINKKFDPKTIY